MLLAFARFWDRLGPWIFFLGSGLCLAFISFKGTGLLVVPGIALFLAGAYHSSVKAAWWGGWLAGSMKAGGALWWLWSTYPLGWVAADPLPQLALIGSFWLTSSISLGIGLAFAGASVPFFRRYVGEAVPYAFPLAWLAAEVIGSFVLSLWLLGPGGYLNIYMIYGYAGLGIGRLDMFFAFAFMSGIYGLTLAAAIIGTLCFLISRDRRWVFALALFVVLSALGSQVMVRDLPVPEDVTRVIAVETYFTTSLLSTINGVSEKEADLLDAVDAALGYAPHVILLPEDSRYTLAFRSPNEALIELISRVGNSDTLLVDSTRVDVSEEGAILRGVYYDLKEGRVAMVDKRFMAPQGEYITYPYYGLLRLAGQTELLRSVGRNQNYVPGPLSPSDLPEDLPATLFCFESVSGPGVRMLGESGDLVLHPVSHARFHSPEGMWHQLDTMLSIQAIWNRQTIVSAANMGPSRAYLPDGSIEEGRALQGSDRWSLIEFEVKGR